MTDEQNQSSPPSFSQPPNGASSLDEAEGSASTGPSALSETVSRQSPTAVDDQKLNSHQVEASSDAQKTTGKLKRPAREDGGPSFTAMHSSASTFSSSSPAVLAIDYSQSTESSTTSSTTKPLNDTRTINSRVQQPQCDNDKPIFRSKRPKLEPSGSASSSSQDRAVDFSQSSPSFSSASLSPKQALEAMSHQAAAISSHLSRRSAFGASSVGPSSSRIAATYSSSSSSGTQFSSLEKLSKKSHRQMIRLSSVQPTSHNSCLYIPGAYSSHGQLSSQMRRQCAISYCCHCQNLGAYSAQGRAQLAGSSNHETTGQSSSNISSSRSGNPTSSTPFGLESAGALVPARGKSSSTVSLKQLPVVFSGRQPETLLEISSRLVAEHIPYEYIEQRYSCIPEPVQRRIIFWSFPRDESYIRLYSSISSIFKQDSLTGPSATFHLPASLSAAANQAVALSANSSASSTGAIASSSSSSSSTDNGSQSGLDASTSSSLFNSGLLLMFSGAVHQVLQVGFNLSGVVTNPAPYTSISSGSLGSTFYGAHGSGASSSSALLDYNPNAFALPDYGRFSLSTSPYLSRDVSPFSRKTTTSYMVSITFDRCKITSVTCTCNSREYHLFWCEHVVALALYRIRRPLGIELRVPVSESLLEFDREQLQKLLQYLIAEHHVQILPTVQKLVDELSTKRSPINEIAGAPDPTAGACVFGQHDWYLNEEKIKIQVRDLVKYVSVNEAKQIIQLFYKIVDMLKIKDSNGPRFLCLITEQFLYSYSHMHKPDEASTLFDPYIFLWDHLINLWIYIVADFGLSSAKRTSWRDLFYRWSHLSNCPREDTYFALEIDPVGDLCYSKAELTTASQASKYIAKFYEDDASSEIDYLNLQSRRAHNHQSAFSGGSSSTSHASSHSRIRKRRIMERALDACLLSWEDNHLQMILREDGPVDRETQLRFVEYFDREGFFIWSEHLPTAATRIASLRVNGHSQEALRLAMAVVRYLKQCQYQKLQQNQKYRISGEFEHASESWIGNPLDPIGVIFDTLAEASLTADSKSLETCYALVGYDKKMEQPNNYYSAPAAQTCRTLLTDLFAQYSEINASLERPEDLLVDRPKYRHVAVPGASHRSDSYLAAAVTVAIVGLAQHRRAPDLDSQRDKTYRQEMRLIRKLLDIKLDSTVLGVLQTQANCLLEIGLLSDYVVSGYSSKHVPFDIAQIPGLVRYLFGALFQTEPKLAYDIGIQSLRFFLIKDESRISRIEQERYNKFHRGIQYYYLDMQLILAKTMLFAARNDQENLQVIFLTIKKNVNSAHYLNKLAHEVFQFSLNGTRHEHLLSISYAFGLHLTKITMNPDLPNDSSRVSIIQWLVSCASEISLESILHLMHNWAEYFSASEAVKQVAHTVLSPNFHVRICNHMFRQDELTASARKLAVECSHKDPASCSLGALKLCNKDQIAFDAISKMVENAGARGHMNAPQLFPVARYMESQNYYDRACKIALLAASQVNIPLSADTHHLIAELQWACSLAQGLGTAELTELINILVKNVRCAPVLADMIRRCTFPPQPIPKHLMLHNSLRHSNFVPDASNLAFMEMEERMRRRGAYKAYPLDRQPVATLLNAAVRAYIETVMKRLEHISPRHYSDFIEFLTRAQETIILAPDGLKEFATLLDKIKTLYKGKKKLMFLVKERFR